MDASPQQLEANVRENLRKHFAQATTTAELIIAGQQLDAAVEQLANWRLGLSSADLDGPSFGAKIKQTWPNHHSELLRLHQRRNDFAHGTIYQDEAAISSPRRHRVSTGLPSSAVWGSTRIRCWYRSRAPSRVRPNCSPTRRSP